MSPLKSILTQLIVPESTLYSRSRIHHDRAILVDFLIEWFATDDDNAGSVTGRLNTETVLVGT